MRAVWLLASALVFGCAPSEPPRIVVVGIDGADWTVIDQLVELDRLPNFKRFREQGQTGVLLTDYSDASPAIWSSIATGKLPIKHGIEGFLVHPPGAYHENPVSSRDRRAAALWNILSHHGASVSVVGWWASWPAESVNGFLVSQRFFLSAFGTGPMGTEAGIEVGAGNASRAAPAGRLTWPEDLAPRLEGDLDRAFERAARSDLGRRLRRLLAETDDPALKHDLAVVDNILKTDVLVDAAAAALDARSDPALTALYFEGIDVVSHLFWKYSYPEKWLEDLPEGFVAYSPILLEYHELIDGLLGEILERAGPEALVVILSDHGFRSDLNPYNYTYNANGLLERSGLLTRDDTGQIDHAKSVWFDLESHPWLYERRVHLNLKGVYPHGTVDPAGAAEALTQLRRSLESLIDSSGQRVITEIAGEPGDSMVTVRINPRLERDHSILFADGPAPLVEIFPPRSLSGNHRPQGIVGFLGPGITPGRLDESSSLDVTPTLLGILRLPLADDMDGTPILPVVEQTGGSLESVASYDFLLDDTSRTGSEESELDEALKERLRSLGYIN